MRAYTLTAMLYVLAFDLFAIDIDENNKCKLSENGIYITGFIKEEGQQQHKAAIKNGVVMIYYGSELLYYLKTNKDGWFETERPLSLGCINEVITAQAFARGFSKSREKRVKIKEPALIKKIEKFDENEICNKYCATNFLEFELTRIQDNDLAELYPTNKITSIYGFIADEEGKGVELAVVSILDTSNEEARSISKTITSQGGYFKLHIPDDLSGKKFDTEISHEAFNTVTINRFQGQYFVPVYLNKTEKHRLYSIGFQLVHVYDYDKLRISALDAELRKLHTDFVLSRTHFYGEPILIRDGAIQQIDKSRWGLDISLSVSRLVEIDENEISSRKSRKADYVFKLGAGLACLIPKSDFLLRFGYARSFADENSIYLGLSMPLKF